MKKKGNKNRSKGDIDYNAVIELNLTMENEQDIYNQEMALTKNYAKKWKKPSGFNFQKANKGVRNLIVDPYARKYQKEWGTKIGSKERDAITKARMREIMRRIREGEV